MRYLDGHFAMTNPIAEAGHEAYPDLISHRAAMS
jgi:hypothetical protein